MNVVLVTWRPLPPRELFFLGVLYPLVGTEAMQGAAGTVTGREDSDMNLLVVSTMGTLSACLMELGKP